ncbi:hypothetical protein ONZ45_g19115 [Pleurotus djamor]|nr:hypothetical protein ONZ45_g19115 [Pleurotus djamor]
MGLIIVDLIGHLSRRRGHPLRSAFFHHNVIPSMTKVALSGARRIRKGGQPPGLEAFMVSGFGYLANCLETTDGFSWVISAIQSGLMQAFLECSPLLSDLDNPADRYMILALFKDIIPKYMVYRSVIQVVDGAMQKVEATPAAHWVLDTPAKEVWLRFKNLASERMTVVNRITAIKGNEIKTCDNVNCQKIDLKNNFRKCGSCSTSLYCSKECQSIAWKEGGHKTTCQLKVQERLEGKNQSISKADIAFFHSVTIEDLGDHLSLLKEIAAKKYPGVPLTSLVACVNYDVSDPVYGVELLYGYEKLQPQTGGSAVAIARNEALIERVQENPDRFCLFQSRVANGEGTQLVLTMVGGDFWDTRNTTLEDTGEMSQSLINDAGAVQSERMSDEEDEEETLTEEQEIELAKKTYNEIIAHTYVPLKLYKLCYLGYLTFKRPGDFCLAYNIMATRFDGEHCSFVLLAEFDIFEGAQLKHQFPQDVGVNEGVLAMSMLPDGAETQMDDWTVFFLNQTPFNAVTRPLSVNPDERTPLLYVLNLVRTKHDKTMKRGGIVRALAICTRHSAIHMFKPLLHLAMDAYFADPSVASLARLYEAINAMEISGAPSLSRSERLIMRGVERKDVFWEKFANHSPSSLSNSTKRKDSHDSSADHGFIIHPISETSDAIEGGSCVTPTETPRSSLEHDAADHITTPERKLSFPSTSPGLTDSLGRSQPLRYWSLRGASATESISRVGSDVSVVGDDTLVDRISLDDPIDITASTTNIPSSLRPLEIPNHDDIPHPNHLKAKTDDEIAADDMNTTPTNQNPHSEVPRTELVKTASFHTDIPDTHFYHTSIEFQGHKLPIKLPLYTFPEEVGDYSLVSLFKVFSSTNLVTGPVHPHLHTNGAQTHPIIILFNALITAKRILFIGHKRPAGEVSQFVLAACALGSGCGVMTGFIKRAFPYATLENKDEWEAVFETTVADMTTVILRFALRPAYIAGVTNPIFESLRMWDVLFDIASGQVTVSKTIFSAYPLVHLPQIGGTSLVSRMAAPTRQESVVGADNDATKLPATNGVKPEFLTRSEASMDSLFIEDIATAIEYRYGENYVRMKFTEYTMRFLRLASRYEEEITGATAIGYTSAPYHEGSPGRPAKLGSGMVFRDEAAFMKEIVANASRVEAWRRTGPLRSSQSKGCLMSGSMACSPIQ